MRYIGFQKQEEEVQTHKEHLLKEHLLQKREGLLEKEHLLKELFMDKKVKTMEKSALKLPLGLAAKSLAFNKDVDEMAVKYSVYVAKPNLHIIPGKLLE